MSAEIYIESLIHECTCIIDGDYGEDTQQHIDNLLEEMHGFKFQMQATGAISYLSHKTTNGVRQIRGWLICNMATISGSPSASVSANLSNVGNSTATAKSVATNTVTISQAIEAVDEDESLSDEQKSEIQKLLVDAKIAASKKDKSLFASIGSKLLKAVEQAAPTLIVKALEFLASQAMGLSA